MYNVYMYVYVSTCTCTCKVQYMYMYMQGTVHEKTCHGRARQAYDHWTINKNGFCDVLNPLISPTYSIMYMPCPYWSSCLYLCSDLTHTCIPQGRTWYTAKVGLPSEPWYRNIHVWPIDVICVSLSHVEMSVWNAVSYKHRTAGQGAGIYCLINCVCWTDKS